MNWFLLAFSKYATFSGRSRRKEFWFFMLFNFIISIILGFLDIILGSVLSPSGTGIFSGIYSLVVFIPSISITVRRLHDIGRSGWWILISLIPLIGFIILLIFACLDSQVGENKYGLNPKEYN